MSLRVAALFVAIALAGCTLLTVRYTPRPGMSSRLTADAAAAAFRQGIEAAALGQPISTCPFAGDDAARAWKAGWKWWAGG
jgi:ribosome modulation factor